MKRAFAIFGILLAATLISHAQMRPDKLPPLITDAIAGPPAMLQVAGAGVASGGPACSSGTQDVAYTDGTNTGTVVSDARGQSFVPATNGSYLYSIEIEIGASEERTVTMRWGTAANLGTYLGETSLSVTDSGYYEFVFADTANQLSTGTTYYFGFISSGTTTTFYRHDNSGAYANGQYYYGTGWNMTTGLSGYDLHFKINKCAD